MKGEEAGEEGEGIGVNMIKVHDTLEEIIFRDLALYKMSTC